MLRLKPGRSLPKDEIDARTIKDAAPILAPAIKHIINFSLQEGHFASNWKPQIIAPHHKKDIKTDVSNYRPVSNIVELGKIVEMEAGDQIVEHFMQHNLFHQAHHGSLPSLDTTTALISIQKFITDAAEKKELCATVFLDQSSTFDIVDHEILLKKLEAYNFGQGPMRWFKSYLSNRT